MTNSNYTHLSLIVDRSGSMSPIASDMEGAIRELLKSQSELEGELKVDITTFDSAIETIYENASYEDIRADTILRPRGMTALMDAIGMSVSRLGTRLDNLQEEERPGKVIVVIVTDGEENSSREYDADSIKELVTAQQDKYSWEFLFLGANIDSFSAAASYGIGRGSTMNWAPSSAGASNMTASVGGYITRARGGVSDNSFTDSERASSLDESR